MPFKEVTSETGKGEFCLYHGNLSVPENEKAVLWILENIFNTIQISFIIAGKNPSQKLSNIAKSNLNVQLIANPTVNEMDELIKKAHVHILPSFNKTGVKIKLLTALFTGRFVVTNNAAIEGSGLNSLCEIADGPDEYKKILNDLFTKSFTEDDIAERKKILEVIYNNEKNVQQLMQLIW